MISVELCPECRVPKPFSDMLEWLSNGDIVQRLDHRNRLAFMESDNLDPLFKNIGDIIGISIEPMVINIAARGNAAYLSKLITKEIRQLLASKQMEPIPFIEGITTLAQISGLAEYEMIGFRFENDDEDYARHRVSNPMSLPLIVGAYAGAVAGIAGGEIHVSHEEVAPDTYIFEARHTKYPAIFKEKLKMKDYMPMQGDIDLPRCSNCGSPAAYADFQWFPQEGRILHRKTGRRMALFGPELLDPIFVALESELGEDIPSVVVEAQKRFVKTGFYPVSMLDDRESLRRELAIRGLGNLRRLEVRPQGVEFSLDNACVPLLVAGLIQGLFEASFGVSSTIDWELSPIGELRLSVKSA